MNAVSGYVQIPLVRLLGASLLIVLAIALSRRNALGLGKQLLIGAIRAAVQLIAIGYALVLIFRVEHPLLVGAVLLVMLSVAATTAARRVAHGPGPRILAPRAFVAIGVAALVALGPVLIWIVPVRPILEARYAIPIGGMMLASAMNVVALVFERIMSAVHQRAASVEQSLALGATPAQAMAPIRTEALRAAMIPTINSLLTVGLVQLPGMMTGQILSGTSPVQAVRYQVVIMYQIVAVAAVAGTVAAYLVRGVMFDDRARLLRW